MNALSQQDIIEGSDLSVNCTASPGNPNSTTFYWTKEDDRSFRQNGPILQLPNITKNSYGRYQCIAKNNYSDGQNGQDNAEMFINVQCKLASI